MPSLKLNAEKTLYAELVRRGLPADYARRTAEELDDHRADLLADLHDTNASDADAIANERLGETRQLAKKIARDYRRRSWFGRWPLLSSAVLAPVAFFAAWIAVSFLAAITIGLAEYLFTARTSADESFWRDAGTAWRLCVGMAMVSSFLMPVLFTWKAGRLALERAQSRVGLIVACVAIAFINGSLFHQTHACPDDPTLACNAFGVFVGRISASDSPVWTALPTQWAQIAVVAVTGAALLGHDLLRRRAALAEPSHIEAPMPVAA